MTKPEIPPLQIVPSSNPDKKTKLAPDWTSKTASDRIIYINLWFFKYGTKDKAHGAAVIFSLLLLFMIGAVIALGYSQSSPEWSIEAFSWLGSTFLFIAGVAVGRNKADED